MNVDTKLAVRIREGLECCLPEDGMGGGCGRCPYGPADRCDIDQTVRIPIAMAEEMRRLLYGRAIKW